MGLTDDDLIHACGGQTFLRGKGYFDDGEVLELDIGAVSHLQGKRVQVFRSKVQGRTRTPYNQTILLFEDSNGQHEIRGHCSCPMGHNCKHVVAGCLEYIHHQAMEEAQRSPSANQAALRWLSEWGGLDQQTDADDTAPFLMFLLSPSFRDGELEVGFRLTRMGKKGVPNKGRELSFDTLCQRSYYTNEFSAQELEIIRFLQISNPDVWGGRPRLHGKLGWQVLQIMLEGGRCYYKDHTHTPLQLAPARAVVAEWLQGASGEYELTMRIEPAADILLLEPPAYLDPDHQQIGLLSELGVGLHAFKHLLKMPAVSAAEVEEFSRRLVLERPELAIPPPKSVTVETLEGVVPVPCLHLLGTQQSDGRVQYSMRLEFIYAGHHLPSHPQRLREHIDTPQGVVQLQRQLIHESKSLQHLEHEGFVHLSNLGSESGNFHAPDTLSSMAALTLWDRFLQDSLPLLEQQGWQVIRQDAFIFAVDAGSGVGVQIEDGDSDWFSLAFELEVDGERLPLLPMITEVLDEYRPDQLPDQLILTLAPGHYVKVSSEQLRPVLETLYELFDSVATGSGRLQFSRMEAARLADLEQDPSISIQGGEALRELGRKLRNFSGIQAVEIPTGFQGTLRDYQQQGLNWLQFLREYQLGGILADDMGLGKTVQTLCHLLVEKQSGRMQCPTLIVAPTSLMGNWLREAALFTPDLKVLILQGSERKQRFAEISGHDIILSTYPLLVRDHEVLCGQPWHYLILDEAHIIKNSKAKASQVVRTLRCNHRLSMTGTPMENHLGELWAQYDFLMPGFLGDQAAFTKRYRTPIEKHGDQEQRQRLSQRIAPFMLRRTKQQVATELPAKTEMVRIVPLGRQQALLYEAIRLSMEQKVQQSIANKGLARSHITILDALLKLRQVCCDPQLLSLAHAKKVKESAKLELLMDMLPELLEEGRRVLLFSSFTKMLAIIEREVTQRGIGYSKLTGQTRKRDEAIELFRSGQVDLFLISLKAGGVGLNLTEADTVIHYDPWWNPAAESQATDRAHRIGQDKPVFVYKLLTEATVEERIQAMQERKRALADGVYRSGAEEGQLPISAEDLQALLSAP